MYPESGAVVAQLDDAAMIQFDEVIEEMAGGGRAGTPGGLAAQVVLSPVAGDVDVSWRRSAIRVKPEEGWKRDRVYRLELRPGILDLRRNRSEEQRTVIFSTGPAIPSAALSGTALHWTEQRALALALIEAVRRPDSVGYLAFADSAGAFALGGVPPGDYVIYAARDENGNRRRDQREAYDSGVVRVDSTATVVLWAFVHDTVGPRLRSVDPVDSLTLRLTFSQHLDPATPLDTTRLRVFALPDTLPVPVAALLTPQAFDSLRAAERARADTARAPAAQADTSAIRRLLAQRPVPLDRLIVRVAQPLAPEAKYLVRVAGARNLNGAVADGVAVVTMPKPAARDTTRAP